MNASVIFLIAWAALLLIYWIVMVEIQMGQLSRRVQELEEQARDRAYDEAVEQEWLEEESG